MAKKKLDLSDIEHVGSFMVDSGQAIIGDPSYLDEWNPNINDDFEPERYAGEYGYLGACQATLSEAGAGTIGMSSAVAVSTGWGDGVYPVYVKRGEGDRIMQVIIDFEGVI